MYLLPLFAAVLAQSQNAAFDPGPDPLLMQHPTVNKTEIVFEFADDLWSVPRAGGEAVRLTSAPGEESNAFFSPDGKWIAFSGHYDGNTNVYVMPADGGEPKRLTADPAPDTVAGWTPDGKSVLFASDILSFEDPPRLFTVPATGGFPTPLPLPMGSMGCYSPDGSHLAYVPGFKWETAWKRYRGGQTYPIWIADLSDSRVKKIPRDNTNDEQPVWMGDKIYYLSDPTGPVGLWSYDVNTGKEQAEVPGDGFDLKSVTAGDGVLVYEKLGSIYLFDPKTRESHRVPISIHGDFQEVRPEFKNLEGSVGGASISPSGVRVAVEARGWILTAPASKGDVHLLDETQGVHRRDPAWSPDGKYVAYFTEVNGHQQLGLWDTEQDKEKLIDLGDPPAYYHDPVWSPDSKKVAYTDNRNKLWILDISSGKNTLVDETIFDNPRHTVIPSWSPDSNWITWARDLDNHLNAVFLYNLETGKTTQVTDGLADADSPIFDKGGKYLYFTASTDVGQASSWLDLSSFNNPNEISTVYALILSADEPNPLQPESDEEKPKEEAPAQPKQGGEAAKGGAPGAGPGAQAGPPKPPPMPKTKIDLDGLESRIMALPMPSAIYSGLAAATPGSFLAIMEPPRASPAAGGGPGTVMKFSFQDRHATPFASGVMSVQTTPDGSKALLQGFGGLSIVSTMMPAAPGQGLVDLSGLEVKIDPRVEWSAMYHEIWRNERMLLYSPTINGLNVDVIEKRYEPFLKNICSRDDLNYLFVDMLGELCVGHEFPGGGDIPEAKSVEGGLLGADYKFENHRYQISRIYTGERWNPRLYAPLAQPGVNAKVGEYLLAVDGQDLTDSMDVYLALEGKAGKQVKIRLGPTPDGKGSREVTVVPVPSEFGLRQRAWEEDNRRYVDKMTSGRAGYVHVPDTAEGGWTAFNRFYYAQVGKDGMVVDERYNHGGLINDFMIREMQKPMDAAFKPRYGRDWPTPGSSIYGPKVMLANQFSGSGGDMFPWLFRHEKVGKIVGKRTWGGLIAAFGFQLIDGGHINAPDDAFYNPWTNTWDVENWGVPPDIDVELDPYEWRRGHDSQLDAAIEEINKELANYHAPKLQHPPYPDRTKIGIRY